MKLYITFLGVFCAGFVQANFLTDAWRQYQAYRAYETADYNQAGAAYTTMLQQDPYDAQVNYNMGLVLYGQKNYEMASHSFHRAAEHSKNNVQLKEQALFNQGNAYVEQKKLYEAMGSYSKVLELNAKNDRARHNLEEVKRLLQEQQQKDAQNQQDQQNKNDQQQGDSQEQQTDDSSQQQSSSQSDSKKSQADASRNQNGQQQNQGQSDGSDQRQERQQQSKDSSNSKDQQGKNESSSKEDVAEKLQKTSKESSLDKDQKKQSVKEASQKKDDGKDGDASKDSLEKSKQSSMNDASKEAQTEAEQVAQLQDIYAGQMEQQPEGDERLDKRAVKVMRQLQEQEDYMQKQLLKMNVSKSGAFGYGQKNW